jgi:phosphatidylglycerophosphate synthase
MQLPMTAPTLAETRKERPSFEVMSELVFRPLAHPLVRVLLPLRVPPPAVVLAGTAVGLWAAWLVWSGSLVWAGVLLQVKTLLDGADGQLARASGRVTVLGRYLDSESDLLVDAFLFAALGHVTGQWVLAVVAFFVLALVLSFDFGLELAWRRELEVAPREARPRASGLAEVLGRVYDVVYAPQDRLVDRVVERQLRGASPEARLRWHDRTTLQVLANFGLSTQLAVLGLCLVTGRPEAYLLFVLVCGLTVALLLLRRARLRA